MNDDMRVVFESRNRRACADRSLMLASANIPHQLVDDAFSCAIVVPAEFSAEAATELRLYDEENPPQRPVKPQPYQYLDAVPGMAGRVGRHYLGGILRNQEHWSLHGCWSSSLNSDDRQ